MVVINSRKCHYRRALAAAACWTNRGNESVIFIISASEETSIYTVALQTLIQMWITIRLLLWLTQQLCLSQPLYFHITPWELRVDYCTLTMHAIDWLEENQRMSNHTLQYLVFADCLSGRFQQSDKSTKKSGSHLSLLQLYNQLNGWESGHKQIKAYQIIQKQKEISYVNAYGLYCCSIMVLDLLLLI